MDYPPPLPHHAGLAGSFLEFTASVQRVCTLCGWIWSSRAGPPRQLCPARGSPRGIPRASGDRDHVSSCALSHPHTLPPSYRLPCSVCTSTSAQSSSGENTLTHIHPDYVLTPGGTRVFKRLSLHKRHKGTTKPSPVPPGWNLRGRGETGRREDSWRHRAHPGSGSREPGHPCLGTLLLPGCPGHAVLRT